MYFPILISKRGTPSEVRLLCRVSVSSLCTLRTFRSIGVRHPWTCCPLRFVSSLCSRRLLRSLRLRPCLFDHGRHSVAFPRHRRSSQPTFLYIARAFMARPFMDHVDLLSYVRMAVGVVSGSLAPARCCLVVMLMSRWFILGGFDGYLTERDARLSALILTDRWLLAHHPSEKA